MYLKTINTTICFYYGIAAPTKYKHCHGKVSAG